MLRNLLSLSMVAVFAISANAATIITQTSAPTVNMPGFTTWTLTAQSDQGPIIGFNFANPNGFFGPMNQINPNDIATVFNDANNFFGFVGADVSQDSQFKIASSSGTVVLPSEGPNNLNAAISFSANPKAGPFAFVQLAIPDAPEAVVEFMGTFTVQGATGPILEQVAGRVGTDVPEPSTFVLAGLALIGLVGYRRRK